MNDISSDEEARQLLAALVALLADARESRLADEPDARKTEILLADAGLNPSAIAPLLGKNPEAVRKAISRARQRRGAADA